MFDHFSWGIFGLLATLYTLAPVLSSARYGDIEGLNRLVAKVTLAPRAYISIHVVFLAVLFAVFWGSTRFYHSLPPWMKVESVRRLSLLDVGVCVVFILLVAIEERWIMKLRPDGANVLGE